MVGGGLKDMMEVGVGQVDGMTGVHRLPWGKVHRVQIDLALVKGTTATTGRMAVTAKGPVFTPLRHERT